jgi:hypothetical protein
MDCEKLEAVMIDELYGELDEVTSAAVKRHLAGCPRCAELLAGLKATRQRATLPLLAAPPGLQDRILEAVRHVARAAPPARGRLSSAISLAGRWSMRPQTAMAALFLVMVGTSVLLLRGKSSRAPAGADITVTEEGTPAPVASAAPAEPSVPVESAPPVVHRDVLQAEAPSLRAKGAAKPEARTAAAGTPDSLTSEGTGGPLAAPRVAPAVRAPVAAAAPPPGWAGEATGAPGGAGGAGAGAAAAAAPGPPAPAARVAAAADVAPPGDPAADLRAARALRDSRGCRAAVARYDDAATRGSGTRTGWDALLEGARCRAASGDVDGARARLKSLLGVDLYRDVARAELDKLDRGY